MTINDEFRATAGGELAHAYDAYVKPGDAVATPDGQLWIVEERRPGSDERPVALALISAYATRQGEVCVDLCEAVHTVVPLHLVGKVADARRLTLPVVTPGAVS